ncbi:STM4015 family protein [Nonomuraea aridisoli]|uniref:STM4015 family protein n=1 Tax=Nonomuraea aridisoli TaxID=2070368 RepID=UPI001F3D8E70|nr:STM4015 family protein [Nonomuraea aridisoli]
MTNDPGETFLPEITGGVLGGHRDHFAGLPVTFLNESVDAPDEVAWLLYDEPDVIEGETESDLPGGLESLLTRHDPALVRALAISGYGASHAPGVLAAYADRLPGLRSVFLGLAEAEQWEISWIRQGDITPLLEAYPRLERLEVRGSHGLELRPFAHDHLRVLRFESGGLPPEVVRALGACTFPALEHLELWLGVEEYGGGATVADLEGVLSGVGTPALRRLGLRDSPIQDDIAAAVAAAPVVTRLEELSLGMGALTDRGAEALLSGQPLTHLRRLDLRHHYLGEEMMTRVRQALPGVEVDLEEARFEPGEWTYVAVSE